MRKYIPVLITFLFLLSSCFYHNNNGYPKKVVFYNEGGTETISGNYSFGDLIIQAGSEEYGSNVLLGDSIISVSYDWLKAETHRGAHSMTLTAQPNRTGRQRKLKIFGYFGNEYAEIDVIQKG